MKILYGLAGEGFGHSSRALVVGDYLKKKGHDLKIVTYGQAYEVLKDRFDVFEVKGFHLFFEKSVLKKRKTIKYNAKNFPKNLRKWKEFHRLMKEFDPDVCISDMEPIVPVLSNWYRLPLICFDNQHRLTNLEINVSREYYGSYLIAKGAIDAFVRKADYFIIASFTDAKIRDKDKQNTIIIPPIIRKDVRSIKPKQGEKILVYLTKKDKGVLVTLRNIREKFVIYGYNIRKRQFNLEFKLRDTFLRDLANCKAIIATAGFTLISEALYLKKPYLAVPLKGQFEQTFNALFLKNSGLGYYTEKLSEKDIAYFICKLGDYKRRLRGYNPDYNKLYRVWDKILKEINRKNQHK